MSVKHMPFILAIKTTRNTIRVVLINSTTLNVSITYNSLPSPTTAILVLSGDQLISFTLPPKMWYSFFKMCSWLTVSQILTFPDASIKKTKPGPDHSDSLS